jgi:hypothetical protein
VPLLGGAGVRLTAVDDMPLHAVGSAPGAVMGVVGACGTQHTDVFGRWWAVRWLHPEA